MATFLDATRNGDRDTPWWIRAAPSRLIAAAGFSLFSLFAAIVLIRRLAGAFSDDISFLGYLSSLLVAGLVCCSLKMAAEWPPHRLDRRACLIFGTLIGLPLDVLAIALLPVAWSYTWIVTAFLWASLVGWFCLSTQSTVWLRYGVQEIIWPEIDRFLFPPMVAVAASSPASDDASASHHVATRLPLDTARYRDPLSEVISELQRRSTATGGDLLEGQLVAVFAAGSKQAVLHVPFIPPFNATPHIECEIADESEARVKVGAVFPYGVRLELKRNTPDLVELHVALEIYAEVSASTPAEAA